MKPKYWFLSVGAGVAVLAASILPSRSIDTGLLQARFRAAEPAIQVRAEKAAWAIRSADYPRALTELKQLFLNQKLTPEQRGAVRSLVTRVERSCPHPTGSRPSGSAIHGGNEVVTAY